MIYWLIICSLIIIFSILSSKLLYKFGVPTLLIFIVMGMLFGSDGIGGIYFDNYELAKFICTLGLIFIMFYGGFGTNWKTAKPVVSQSLLMSTVGVAITAGLTGVFCYYVIKTTLLEGLLIGAVVASTDAASVFAILRSRNLNFKGGVASLLEIESGSNDPFAYMLTAAIVTLMSSNSYGSIVKLVFFQIVFGLLVGFSVAKLSSYLLQKINFEIASLYSILIMAIALFSYSLAEVFHGNGYLSVYIVGIVLGNSKLLHKKSLVNFFDGISWLMQIMLFFTLGLLSFPSHLLSVLLTGTAISLFLIFVARPVTTFGILSWFKTPIKQQLLVSWVGLRGAASIVFAIFAVTSNAIIKNDVFHIVFFVALFSVGVQGTLIPFVSKKLDMIDTETPVSKTFTDYQGEINTSLIELPVTGESVWLNKTIMDAEIPEEILVVMIKRENEVIVPKGSTVIKDGDILVLSGVNFDSIQK